jgi:hypothetical protein
MKRRKITLASKDGNKTIKTRIVTDENEKSLFAVHRTMFKEKDFSSYTVTHVPTGYAIWTDLGKDVAEILLEKLATEKSLDWSFTDPKKATKLHGQYVKKVVDNAKGILTYRMTNNLR